MNSLVDIPKTKSIKIELEFSKESLFGHFQLACHTGDLETVVKILETNEIDVDETDEETRKTILYSTLKKGKHIIAEKLLERGANPNLACCLRYPLVRACYKNDLESAELLLKYGADPNIDQDECYGITPLTASFGFKGRYNNKSRAIIKLLLDHGADPNKKDASFMAPLMCAIIRKDYEIVDLLFRPRYDNKLSLFMCCTREYEEKSLLHDNNLPRDMFNEIMKTTATYADPDSHLYSAIGTGDVKIVTKLLENGANPNKGHIIDGPEYHLTITPLDRAVLNDEEEIVELLLAYGADPCLGDFMDLSNVPKKIIEIVEKAAKSRFLSNE